MGAAIKDARERLIECGRELAKRDGYGRMRIQDLTSECGMATGTFYSYFDSKGCLFQSIIESDWEAASGRMDAQLKQEEDLRARLRTIYESLNEFHCAHFSNLVEMGIDPENSARIRQISERLLDDLSERVRESLALAEGRGQIRLEQKVPMKDVCTMIVENMLAIARNDRLDFDGYADIMLEWLSSESAGRKMQSCRELSGEDLAYLAQVTPGKKGIYRVREGRAEALYLSPALHGYFGVGEKKLKEIAEADSLAMVVPEDLPGLRNVIDACIDSGKPFHYCWRIRHESSEPRWVQADGCLVGTMDGSPVISVVFNGIASENDIYQTILDGTQTRIYVCDSVTYDILYENQSAAESTGRRSREGQFCYQVIRGQKKPCEDCFLYGRTEGGAFEQVRYNQFTGAWEQLSGKYVNWCGHDASIHYIRDITDLKVAQQQYESEKKRYASAVEGANLTVWEYHVQEHRIIGGRSAMARYSLDNIVENVPESILPLIEEGDRENFLQMYRRIDAGDTHVFGDYWIKAGQGRQSACEHVEYTVEKDSSGKPYIAYGVSSDITSQVRERLRFKEAMQEMLRANPQALCHFTMNLTSDQCFEGQGRSADVIKAIQSDTVDGMFSNIIKLIPDEGQRREFLDRFSREKLIRSFQAGQTYISMEYERKKVAGGLISVRTATRMIKNPMNGDITAAVYSVDITQQKRLSDVLSIITSQEHQMVSMLDLKTGRIEALYIGRDMPEVYDGFFHEQGDSCDVEELKRKNCENWIYPEDRELYLDSSNVDGLPARLAESGKFEYTVRVLQPGSPSGIGVRKFQHYWLNHLHEQILIITSDVTESVRHQQEELEKEKKLRQAALAANKAKTEFLSRMSHDIRTPINGIMGMVHIAKEQDNPPRTEDCLQKIDVSSKFLLSLINEVLDMSKAESGKLELHPEPYRHEDLKAYLMSVIKPLCDDKGVIFIFEDDTEQGLLAVTDILRTNQIYFNILSNAVKYTPAGGTVTCRLWSRQLEPGKLSVKFTVSDTGIGISREFQKKLFDPFVQENRDDSSLTRGTGLGLAIVRKIVDIMGGTIEVSSEVGKGSTFTVNLVFDSVTEEEADRSVQDESPDAYDDILAGRHILLCEDHPLNQEIARALLEEKRIIVTIADNGREGVTEFSRSKENYYDAVLMDLRMPVMNGYEAAAAIRALNRSDARAVPIIAMSADAFEEDVQRCREAGMNDHISKPIEPAVMFRKIAEGIGSRS